MDKELIFKVIEKDGHEYCAYDDGTVIGFGDDPIVINRWPSILAYERSRSSLAVECPASNATESREGGGHSTAPNAESTGEKKDEQPGEK